MTAQHVPTAAGDELPRLIVIFNIAVVWVAMVISPVEGKDVEQIRLFG